MASSMGSPSPGGMSTTRKSRGPHRVTASISIRASVRAGPRRGEGLFPAKWTMERNSIPFTWTGTSPLSSLGRRRPAPRMTWAEGP